MALSTVVFDVGETLVDEATAYERWETERTTLRPHVDFVGSSERWGVEKPDSGFFAHVVDEAGVPAEEILYVGDRVDNDVVPALAAGLHAVRVRRGAHARTESPAGTVTIDSLAGLPEALERV